MSSDFLMRLWPCFVFLAVAAICVLQVARGLRTGVISVPVQFFVFEEFERDRNAAYFWAVVAFDLLLLGVALAAAIYAGVVGV